MQNGEKGFLFFYMSSRLLRIIEHYEGCIERQKGGKSYMKDHEYRLKVFTSLSKTLFFSYIWPCGEPWAD